MKTRQGNIELSKNPWWVHNQKCVNIIHVFIINILKYFVYVKGRGDPGVGRDIFHPLINSPKTRLRAGPCQELGMLSESLLWVAGTWALRLSSAVLPGSAAGSWMGSSAARPGPCIPTLSSLAGRATTLAPLPASPTCPLHRVTPWTLLEGLVCGGWPSLFYWRMLHANALSQPTCNLCKYCCWLRCFKVLPRESEDS